MQPGYKFGVQEAANPESVTGTIPQVPGYGNCTKKECEAGATEAKLTEMKIRLKKIMESSLIIVQEIDAMKTFVLPMLDFMMLNGDIG
jgi:hypothetical protein